MLYKAICLICLISFYSYHLSIFSSLEKLILLTTVLIDKRKKKENVQLIVNI